MRNDLNRRTEIIAAAFLFDDVPVDTTSRDIVLLVGRATGEPFVMPQIKVGFGTIVGDEHLTMLVRRHRAGIDIQIRVEFTDTHPVTACLKECSQCCSSYAFSKGRNHAASDEYISRHGLISLDFLD